jgi:hydrogenase-1 operon protein HyaF
MTMPETSASTVEFNIQIGDELTQNVKPLLHEIKHALLNLIENGDSSSIDLRSIPLAPGEEQKLLDTLGTGEVQTQLNALGLSEIIETQYAGVWVITHHNDEGSIIGRFIEVTTVPDILCSQREDIINAYKRLELDDTLDSVQLAR